MTSSCPGCGEGRAVSEFKITDRATSKPQVYSKECGRRYLRDHYARNKAYYVQKAMRRNRGQRRSLVDVILEHFSTHPCVDYGETDPMVLDFDHIDPSTKEFDITSKILYGSS